MERSLKRTGLFAAMIVLTAVLHIPGLSGGMKAYAARQIECDGLRKDKDYAWRYEKRKDLVF